MRILLANQAPLEAADGGLPLAPLAHALLSAGHEVQGVVVDGESRAGNAVPIRRIICRKGDAAADLPFDSPRLGGPPQIGQTFSDLTNRELAEYRDVLRSALDAEIEAFDPHVVHAQHIWILGHLALEAGVPYVLSTSGLELPVYRLDPRFRRYADEAAENAGRILATSDAVRDDVLATFGELDGRVVIMPAEMASDDPSHAGRWLSQVYREVLTDRFGARPES
jgi:hypothetical protein